MSQNDALEPKIHVRELTNAQYEARISEYQESLADASLTLQRIQSDTAQFQGTLDHAREEVQTLQDQKQTLRESIEKAEDQEETLKIQAQEALRKRDVLLQEQIAMCESLETFKEHFKEIKRTGEQEISLSLEVKQVLQKEIEVLQNQKLSKKQEYKVEEVRLKTIQAKANAVSKEITESKRSMREVYEHIDQQREAVTNEKRKWKQYSDAFQDFTHTS